VTAIQQFWLGGETLGTPDPYGLLMQFDNKDGGVFTADVGPNMSAGTLDTTTKKWGAGALLGTSGTQIQNIVFDGVRTAWRLEGWFYGSSGATLFEVNGPSGLRTTISLNAVFYPFVANYVTDGGSGSSAVGPYGAASPTGRWVHFALQSNQTFWYDGIYASSCPVPTLAQLNTVVFAAGARFDSVYWRQLEPGQLFTGGTYPVPTGPYTQQRL
jgi:hypothetical protein